MIGIHAGWAMYCLFVFYMKLRTELEPIRPGFKFLCVKVCARARATARARARAGFKFLCVKVCARARARARARAGFKFLCVKVRLSEPPAWVQPGSGLALGLGVGLLIPGSSLGGSWLLRRERW